MCGAVFMSKNLMSYSFSYNAGSFNVFLFQDGRQVEQSNYIVLDDALKRVKRLRECGILQENSIHD